MTSHRSEVFYLERQGYQYVLDAIASQGIHDNAGDYNPQIQSVVIFWVRAPDLSDNPKMSRKVI